MERTELSRTIVQTVVRPTAEQAFADGVKLGQQHAEVLDPEAIAKLAKAYGEGIERELIVVTA